MKKITTLVSAVILFLGTSAVTAQKIAHINTQELIQAMPETRAAQNELERMKNAYEAELSSMARELEAKVTRYRAEAESKSDQENERRAIEVQTAQQKIAEYRNNAFEDLSKKESELLMPIFDKATKAIERVAKDKGIQYVLDASQGGGVIVAEGEDLLQAAKRQLGI